METREDTSTRETIVRQIIQHGFQYIFTNSMTRTQKLRILKDEMKGLQGVK